MHQGSAFSSCLFSVVMSISLEEDNDLTRKVMTIRGDKIDKVKSFKCLGSFVQKNSDGFDKYMKHSIKRR